MSLTFIPFGGIGGSNAFITVPVSTPSAAYISVPGLEITPGAGVYMAWFSGTARVDPGGTAMLGISIPPGAPPNPESAVDSDQVINTPFCSVAGPSLIGDLDVIRAVFGNGGGGMVVTLDRASLMILRLA